MSKIKNGGLDQYGAGPFEQQQFGTAGVERVYQFNTSCSKLLWMCKLGVISPELLKMEVKLAMIANRKSWASIGTTTDDLECR